jgi:ERCC4-related helicase
MRSRSTKDTQLRGVLLSTMTQPSSTPSQGALALSSLEESSLLTTPGKTFPLTDTQTASVQKLASLWSTISRQAALLLTRNEHLLTTVPPEQRSELLGMHAAFVAPWSLYSCATKALREAKSNDLEEARTLLNGLHELTVAASLLASYGTPSFILRTYQHVLALADPSQKLHAHIKRLYKHPLTVDALNIQLSSIGGSPISISSLPTNSDAQHALARLSNESLLVKHAHAKEEHLIERIQSLATTSHSSTQRLVIITSPDEVELLTSRLHLKSSPSVRDSLAAISDASLPHTARAPALVCAPQHAHLVATQAPTSIVVYSPLFIESSKINTLSLTAVSQLKTFFPQGTLSVLTTSAETFSLDELVTETLSSHTPLAAVTLPARPGSSTSTTPPLISTHVRTRPASITVDIPRPKEGSLFDQATLDSLKPPPPSQPPRKPLPQIDPTTLPKTVSQLNAQLGITTIKDALILREDQVQELLRMLAADSFDWLYKSPTGSGKTAFASLTIATRLGNSPSTPQSCQRGYRVAYVTPNVDLCLQAKNEFLRFIDVTSEDIAILNGKTPLTQRRAFITHESNKILVGTPGTLRTTLTNAPTGRGYDSLAFMIVDEFQTAEGDHDMARIIREATAAKVPVLVLSGTPVRDEEDQREKRELLPHLQGALVPHIPQPLKNHALVPSRVTPQLLTLIQEIGQFAHGPYIDAREQLLNGRSFFNQAEGRETKTLFDNRQKLKRKPHIVSFSPPTADRISELKAELDALRSDIKTAIQPRRDAGIPVGELLQRAATESANASLNLGRMGSINAALAPLSSGGRFPFLFDFSESWFPHVLESRKRGSNLPLYQTFIKSPDYRGIVRHIAAETPFYHLLQATSGRDALQRAFGLPDHQIPLTPKARQSLFLSLAAREMSLRVEAENEKELNLFEHIEERLANTEARGILIFAEPRYLTRYLALRLHHRFQGRGVGVAFVTGEGDGFAGDLAQSLDALHANPNTPQRKFTSSFADVRAAFQAPSESTHRRADIIVATSRLAVGHDLSAAAEAHLYTMHADAQRLLQTIGRAGRPKGDNFFGRVGQCYYHVTQNTFERYLFLSAIKKYSWMRNSLTTSESWQELSSEDAE